MSFRDRLKGAAIGIAICVVSLPVAVGITIALLPLWRWIEATFGVESIGHSGPAEWCYWTVYVLVTICAALIWSARRSRRTREQERKI